MRIISDPRRVSLLPIHPSTQAQIDTLLFEPFPSIELTVLFWQEQKTYLVMLEDGDQLEDILSLCPLLQFCLSTPEFIDKLEHHWYLALYITTDEGDGLYLLFQKGKHPTLDSYINHIS
jgi:hypothetical protein